MIWDHLPVLTPISSIFTWSEKPQSNFCYENTSETTVGSPFHFSELWLSEWITKRDSLTFPLKTQLKWPLKALSFFMNCGFQKITKRDSLTFPFENRANHALYKISFKRTYYCRAPLPGDIISLSKFLTSKWNTTLDRIFTSNETDQLYEFFNREWKSSPHDWLH